MEHFLTYLNDSNIIVENLFIIDNDKQTFKAIIKEINYPIFLTLHRNEETYLIEEISIFTGLKSARVKSNEQLVKFIKTLY